MPTRKSASRAPRQRVDRVAPATVAAPVEAPKPVGKKPRSSALRNPLFPVGVSLYPLDNETQSPDEWYGRSYDDDLDALEEAHFGLVRIFASWRELEPQVGQYSDEALDRLVAMVASAGLRRMQAIVCLFADDRHAELSEVGWGKKRDARTDTYLLQRQAALAAKVASALRSEKSVFAWQLGNEAFLSGFSSSADLLAWVSALRDAIREQDSSRPIGLGADAETLFRTSGVNALAAIDRCEFSVAHATAAYRAYAAGGPLTSGPATYLDEFLLRLARRGRPVLLDDVGIESLGFSAAEEAAHVRTALWGGLCNRAAGALVRRFRDMETERREPYFLDPYEVLIGIADSEGERKPAYEEVKRFVSAASQIDLKTHTPVAERTAIVMPAERFEPLPNLAGLYDPRACLQSFIAAKTAQLPVSVVREDDDFADYQVLIVPSAFALSDASWERIATFVQTGGTLLASYGGGDAHASVRELFGMEFLGDGGPRDTLSCRVAHADILGALTSFDSVLAVPNFALLSSGVATVVATDATGSPLLTVNQVGQGRAAYCSVPLERAIAQDDPWATPAPVRHFIREVYGAVARGAGCGAPVGCDVPDVEIAVFQGDADDVVVCINHSAEKVAANLSTDRRVASIADVRGGTPVAVGTKSFGVTIERNGVVALRLTYA